MLIEELFVGGGEFVLDEREELLVERGGEERGVEREGEGFELVAEFGVVDDVVFEEVVDEGEMVLLFEVGVVVLEGGEQVEEDVVGLALVGEFGFEDLEGLGLGG